MDDFPEMVCEDCGAEMKDDLTCQEMYAEVLAREFSDPVCGKVHHLTVLCYNIQHPGSISRESLEWSISTLAAAMKGKWSGEDLLQQVGQSLAKKEIPTLLSSPEEPVDGLTRNWSMTIADVYNLDAQGQAERVRAWAEAILNDLEMIDRL